MDRVDQTDKQAVILVLETDLWFLSRIRSAASAVGARIDNTSRIDQLVERAVARRPAVVLINMAMPGQDWVTAIRMLKAAAATAAVPIVAFGPHVDTEAQTAARMAGADRVLSNQRFTETLPEVLSRYVPTVGRG